MFFLLCCRQNGDKEEVALVTNKKVNSHGSVKSVSFESYAVARDGKNLPFPKPGAIRITKARSEYAFTDTLKCHINNV